MEIQRSPPQGKQDQSKGKQKPQGKPQPSSKLRGRPQDSPEVRLSKTLSWVLRHGAQQEGLAMRSDGFVRVHDLLALPKLKALDFPALQKIVQDDKKQRYHLTRLADVDAAEASSEEWWMRANQGHSLRTIEVENTPVLSVEDIPTKIAVHGTSLAAWESIKRDGLSKMKRNHIHLAQGVAGSGVVSGMRTSSQVYIYVDVQKAIDAGLAFFLSRNGVVLTAGDDAGYIRTEFFERVENRNGQPISDWTPAQTQSSPPKE